MLSLFQERLTVFKEMLPFFRVHLNFVRLLIIAYGPKIKVVHIFICYFWCILFQPPLNVIHALLW